MIEPQFSFIENKISALNGKVIGCDGTVRSPTHKKREERRSVDQEEHIGKRGDGVSNREVMATKGGTRSGKRKSEVGK